MVCECIYLIPSGLPGGRDAGFGFGTRAAEGIVSALTPAGEAFASLLNLCLLCRLV